MRTIDLRIERIVIDGVTLTTVERARLRTALEARLSDRLSRGVTHGLDADALRASHGEAALRAPLVMPAEATPGQWGRGIADAVLGSLTNDVNHANRGRRGDSDGTPAESAGHGISRAVNHESRPAGSSEHGAASRSSSSITSTNGGAR